MPAQNPNPQNPQLPNPWYLRAANWVAGIADRFANRPRGLVKKHLIAGSVGAALMGGIWYLSSRSPSDMEFREIGRGSVNGGRFIYSKNKEENIIKFEKDGVRYEFVDRGNDGRTDVVKIRTKSGGYVIDEKDEGMGTLEGEKYDSAMDSGDQIRRDIEGHISKNIRDLLDNTEGNFN